MAFHDAATPEDAPDYELEAEIARLAIATSEPEPQETGESDAEWS